MNAEPAVNAPDLRTPEEFTRFYRTHLPAIYGYLLRLCGNDRATAEDLTQETWMALAKAVKRGRNDCADVRWLMTVARSRFLDHARREQRSVRKLALISSSDEPVEQSEWPTAHDVLASLSHLQPLHRMVLVMRYVEEMPVPTVAETIGRNVTATNSLLARARAELRANRRDLRHD